MKKKVFVLLGSMSIITCVLAASWNWEKVSDSCHKCKVTATERICGKCNGFLYSQEDKREGNYTITTYQCNDCKHVCTFKKRYE